MPLFEPESSWEPTLPADLPSWAEAQRIGLDIETCDPDLKQLGPGVRRGGFICGVSFTIEDGEGFYLPTRHLGGDNLSEDAVMAYLRDQAKAYTGTIVTANGNYDLDYLEEAGVTFPVLTRQRDVQIADPLLDELQDSYSLDAIAKRRGFAGKNEALLREAANQFRVDPKKELWKLPARYVAPYAIEDSALVLQINRQQEREIEAEELWDIYNLESDLQPVLLRVRRRGVRIDTDALDRVITWSVDEERRVLAEIKRLSGEEIKLGAIMTKAPLVRAFQRIGVKLPETPSGQPKLDKYVLEAIDQPMADLVRRARQMSQLRGTFANSVRNHMTRGRLHCEFNQLPTAGEDGEERGARFGRMSSSHPNLQQQPSRGDYAARWRAIYVPDNPDQLWLSADYSQQEPRWLTHFAELYPFKQPWVRNAARTAADRYRDDPLTDNHQMTADICGIDRKPAKEIFLGYCYGMGGGKLAKKLGLPTVWKDSKDGSRKYEAAGPEAQAIFDQFNERMPHVRRLAWACEEWAAKRGFITTILGRRCRFPVKTDGSYDWTHKALNRLIQGSSADQTKRAMVEIDRAGLPLQLQVHDEVDASIDSMEQAEAIAEIMRTCVPANIPFRIDVETGPNWGEVA